MLRVSCFVVMLVFGFSVGPVFSATDLSSQEHPTIADALGKSDSSSKQWYDKFEISGAIAGAYLNTGPDRPSQNRGSLSVYEALLQFEAEPVENAVGVVQYFPVWWIPSGSQAIGEAHLNLKNIWTKNGESLLGIKVGRFDVPFGEDYNLQLAAANPMISRSAAWWWGWDEGIELYGKVSPNLGWIFAVTNGNAGQGPDDHGSKAISGKINARPFESFELSLSGMHAGRSTSFEFWQGLRHLSGIVSASALTEAKLYEIDLKYVFGQRGYVALQGGGASIREFNAARGDETLCLRYFSLEPLFHVNDRLYVVGRFSGIGTFDDGRTYSLNDGFSFTSVSNAKSFTRWGLGVGYKPNSATVLKLEYGGDRFTPAGNATILDDRRFFGAEALLKF